MPITDLVAGHYRIELPVPLLDSTQGVMTHFELVTVHLPAAAPNRSFLEVHAFGLDRFLARPLENRNGNALAPDTQGHDVHFDWVAVEAARA